MPTIRNTGLGLVASLVTAIAVIVPAAAQDNQKPNIVIIWGDDIGQSNISAYYDGADGLPHAEHRPRRQGRDDLHRLLRRAELHGRPGVVHHRPARSAHRPDQGRPARRARLGLQKEDPTIAELLKPHGYATGQFGKNHLGDRNEFLPTVHGFDEFYGNLYHLNAEEEPELPDYPKDPAFRPEVRPARRAGLQGHRHGRPDRRPALRQGRQADDQGHRPADQEADGDDRRRHRRPRRRLHRAAGEGRQAVLPLGELHPHALPHASRSPRASASPAAGRANITTR